MSSILEHVFDEKTGCTLLHRLVEYACSFPTDPGPALSIAALTTHQQWGGCSSDLQDRFLGSVGGPLHHAAARGHAPLVQTLLAAGFDPSHPCDTSAFASCRGDTRRKGAKALPLPEDWAKVRGHGEVVEMLQKGRREIRPDQRRNLGRNQLSEAYRVGKLETFFPDRGFGFISTSGSKGVFVHLTTLRAGSNDVDGLPMPGQKLCFLVAKDGRNREKATHVVCGDDFSYIKLYNNYYDAEADWCRYNRDGSDESSEDEEEDDEEDDDNCHNNPDGYAYDFGMGDY